MYSEFDGTGPMVVCPQGHANVWNYKFCGQCGLPLVATPALCWFKYDGPAAALSPF